MNFSKEISLGNVITILGLLVSVVWGYGKLESRVALIEASELSREKTILVDVAERTRQQNEMRQDLREIRQDLKALNTSIIERKGVGK